MFQASRRIGESSSMVGEGHGFSGSVQNPSLFREDQHPAAFFERSRSTRARDDVAGLSDWLSGQVGERRCEMYEM